MITEHLILNLILILTVAWILGKAFSRFGLPVVLGELLAGLVLGPPLLGIVTADPSLELMAEFGIFFLMFYAGVEMDPKELIEHIGPALLVAVGGFVLPFALGAVTCHWFGGTLFQSLIVGMGLSITSLAVQARILHDMQIQKTTLGHIIIGAAIADDILSLIVLSVLLGVAQNGSIQVVEVGMVFGKVLLFFGAAILIGHYIVPHLTKRLDDREAHSFTFALLMALTMAYIAHLAGLHLIIGAFVAGQFVRKEILNVRIYEKISDRFFGLSYGFLAPIFFVSLSFHLVFPVELPHIAFFLVITLAAIVGKVAGCGIGARLTGLSFWESSVVGFGMNGRGAMEFVVAMVVLKLSNELIAAGSIAEPLLTDWQFSALVLMAFVTTFLVPLTLKWGVREACHHDEHIDFCILIERGKRRFRL